MPFGEHVAARLERLDRADHGQGSRAGLPAPDENDKIKRASAIPNIPTFEEYYAKHKGGEPSGIQYTALRKIVDTFMAMFRTSFATPGAPKESVEALQAGFRSLWKDEKFLSDYERRVKNRPDLIVGAAVDKRIADLANVDPKVKKYFEDYIAKVSK